MRRRSFIKTTAAAGAAATAAPAIWSEAKAQARNETLLIVNESPPNSMDIHGVGANRPAYEVSWNTHDRLITYGAKKDANGNDHYDYTKLEPELSTDWNVTPNSATFKLRRDAKFHDGTPITAKDVKWSFDRAVTVGGFPTFQMKAGSLEKPEQFVVVDDHTFRVDFLRADKLTMPDIGVPVPVIMNSELCKKNATATDPWAMEWCKNNTAAGGAYRIERWQPGQEVVYVRNDDWKNGPMPKIKRVIMRIIPSAGNRRAPLERGDADLSVSGWMLVAMRSGQLAGVKTDDGTLAGVRRLLDASTTPADPTRYAYNPRNAQQRRSQLSSACMTAVGALMKLHTGTPVTDPGVAESARLLAALKPAYGTPKQRTRDSYLWYYSSQVLVHAGGAGWDPWYGSLVDTLSATQETSGPATGSWDPMGTVPDRWGEYGGRLYVTTLHLLALEVPARHLPTYSAGAKPQP